RVDSREPDVLDSLAGGQLDRQRVHAANRRVQGDRTNDVHPGHRLTRQRRAPRGVRVVRLDHVPLKTLILEVPGDLQVAGYARHGVRTAVYVKVVGAANEVTRSCRRSWVTHLSPLSLPRY